MKKKVILGGVPALLATLWITSCKNNNSATPQITQYMSLYATLNGQGVRPTATASTETANFTGSIDPNSRVLTYTLTYSSGFIPTSAYLYRITNTTDSTGVADIALISGLSSGTSTSPGNGTSTSPGSGTSTSPGSGTSTTPGSSTSTGTGSSTITSPYTGNVTLTQAKIDSMRNGYYYISIGTAAYPNGAVRGRIRTQ